MRTPEASSPHLTEAAAPRRAPRRAPLSPAPEDDQKRHASWPESLPPQRSSFVFGPTHSIPLDPLEFGCTRGSQSVDSVVDRPSRALHCSTLFDYKERQNTPRRGGLDSKTFHQGKFSLVSLGPLDTKERCHPSGLLAHTCTTTHRLFFGQGCHFVIHTIVSNMAPLPVAGLHAAAAAADGAESSGVISSSACFQSRLVSTPAPATARSSRRSVPTTAC